MFKNKKLSINKLIVFFLIIFSLIIKLSFVKNFHSEVDDQISIVSKLVYENFSIYDISNEKDSPSYNGKLKKFIRNAQSKNNNVYDYVEKIFSKILVNISPSKNSTYAPMQYFIFSGLINNEQNYDELKFYSRLPSIIFSILTLILTYFFSIKVFKKDDAISLLPVILVCFSYPLFYTSIRSYNYAAGTLAVVSIFFLTYLEMIKKSIYFLKIDEHNFSFKKNLSLAFVFSFFAHLNYIVLTILPLYFIVNFKYNYPIKKIFSKYNINLLFVGVFYLIFILPLLAFMLKLRLYEHGITTAAGEFGQYHLTEILKQTHIKNIIYFYINNFYLVISKNLSFFLDDFYISKLLQPIIFVFVVFGIFISFRENKKLNKFSKLSIFFFIYYILLVYLEISSLGPTRHSTFYIPLFAILFAITFQKVIMIFFKRSSDYTIYIFLIFSTFIFLQSYSNFKNLYKDPFSEKNLNKIIKEYDVAYINNNASLANQICIMDLPKVIIRTCPNLFQSRYAEKFELNQLNLKELKKDMKSIVYINVHEHFIKDEKLLSENNFKLIKKINDTKFNFHNSPLYISASTPNLYEVLIYK